MKFSGLRFALFPLAIALSTSSRAEVVPAPFFQNHAVFQQGKALPVWGNADSGEKVSVTFNGKTLATVADGTGAWRVTLPPPVTNSTPATLTITGKNTILVSDILVGEVWLAAGQSNMEYKLKDATEGPAAAAAANDPLLREFAVKYKLANEPQTQFEGGWSVCNSTTAPAYSAVGYFFAREIREKLGVPVGIINSSWGGTDIETWMPPSALAGNPEFAFVNADWQKFLDSAPELKAKYEAALAEDEIKAAEAKARGVPYKKPWRQPPPVNDGSPHMKKPSAAYNGKIHPLAPVSLAGILWYQGEGGIGENYRKLFPALITGWRSRFGQGDLPFYWVQLPNWKWAKDWPSMREAQSSALSLPATNQAITIDIGETANIHPHNKEDVSHRLALIALHDTYGHKIISSGPRFAKATFSGANAKISFTEVGGGLTVKGDALKGFELAGADRVFRPAEATIEGETVIVHSAEVPKPIAVRYAWSNDPAATLFNKADLPAAPFRSDQ